jgi:hypothetical protein
MRSGSRRVVVWGLTLLAVVIVATRPLDRDRPAADLVRAAFTLFVVDAGGTRQPVAHFNGRAWAPLCEEYGPPDTLERVAPVLAIEGSRGSPLFPVRLLSDEPRRWQRARDAVQALTDGAADVPGRIREAAVYVPVGLASSAVFVDLVMRSTEPRWWGVAASGWVHTDGDRVWVLAPRVVPFASYEEFISTPRLHPLGVADVGRAGERVWVMQRRAPDRHEIELVQVTADEAGTSVKVPQGGC